MEQQTFYEFLEEENLPEPVKQPEKKSCIIQ
jgi:hypothetical protein